MNGPSAYRSLPARPWAYHTLFWIAYYIFACLISLSIHQIHDLTFYATLLTLVPPDMLLVYGNLYILIPFLLLKRKPVLYVVALLGWLSFIAAAGLLLHRWYASLGVSLFATAGELTSRNFFVQLLNAIYLVGITTGLKFLKDWMIQNHQLQENEKQRVITELNFLKSQVHPHFFFNTLNNLYSLTLDKSDRAPEVVQKLADLMSYLLYESSAPTISLQKEIDHLESYIDLERLRFEDRLTVTFKKEGDIRSVEIPPLILLAFVENSFKHGMNHLPDKGQITLRLRVEPAILFFEVTNPVEEPAADQQSLTKPAPRGNDHPEQISFEEAEGIGLKNVIRRLDLLYGTRYRLDKTATATLFRVTLQIPLS